MRRFKTSNKPRTGGDSPDPVIMKWSRRAEGVIDAIVSEVDRVKREMSEGEANEQKRARKWFRSLSYDISHKMGALRRCIYRICSSAW